MKPPFRLGWILLLAVTSCSNADGPPQPSNQHDAAPDIGVPDVHAPPRMDAAWHGDARKPSRDAGTDARKPSVSEAGAEAGERDAAEAGGTGAGFESLLSQTGLFKDVQNRVLGDGVRPYQILYPLWSDGAEKARYIYLPEGEKIDTSDMDFWVFPVGTRAWKDFTVDGKLIETRMVHKAGPKPSDWVMIAYHWKSDGSDAVALPSGLENADGTPHDIPAAIPDGAAVGFTCHDCHDNMKDRILGFNAIELSHALTGVTLTELIQEGRLTDPPEGLFTLPGDATARAVLGYFHGNCGDCHNPTSMVFPGLPMQLFESTKTLGTVEDTTAYRTTVHQPDPAASLARILPGDPEHSVVYQRMRLRGGGSQMPPIGTEIVDQNALNLVAKWIRSLAVKPGDGGTEGGRTTDGG